MGKGIAIKCERGHEQFVGTPNHTHQDARDWAAIMDGTHALFAHPPRVESVPESDVARCQVVVNGRTCRAWFIAIAVGFEEGEP